MIARLARELYHSTSHPTLSKLGFVRQGLGLEYRSKKLSPAWTEHFSASRAAQQKWIEQSSLSARSITILGAGRLLDLDHALISKKFEKVVLVDADPSCRAHWKNFSRNQPKLEVVPRTCDLTGLMEIWSTNLALPFAQTNGMNWKHALDTIETFETQLATPALYNWELLDSNETSRAILSLNLLSQIPLFWRDTVEKLLVGRFGRKFVLDQTDEWLRRIQGSCKLLVEQHLNSLNVSNAESILLISDVDYVSYRGPSFKKAPASESPLNYQAAAAADLGRPCVAENWTINPTYDGRQSNLELTPALFGISLDCQGLALEYLTNYRPTNLGTWQWHISPFGSELAGQGTVHRVVAVELSKKLEPIV